MGNSVGISWACEEPGTLVSEGGVIDITYMLKHRI